MIRGPRSGVLRPWVYGLGAVNPEFHCGAKTAYDWEGLFWYAISLWIALWVGINFNIKFQLNQ